jgi:hypothetical protein
MYLDWEATGNLIAKAGGEFRWGTSKKQHVHEQCTRGTPAVASSLARMASSGAQGMNRTPHAPSWAIVGTSTIALDDGQADDHRDCRKRGGGKFALPLPLE